MKKENVVFSRKDFLNLPGLNSTASIVTHINRNDMNEYGDYQRSEVHFSMSDCTRTIDFDIELSTEYERENAIYKVDKLIEVLSDFKMALEKECEHQRKMEKNYKKRRIKELEKEKQEAEKEGGEFRKHKQKELSILIKQVESWETH